MDTSEIMQLALELAGQSEVPPDSGIDVPATDVRKVLIGIDVDSGELRMAQERGYDLVISHHPTGGRAHAEFPRVLEKHGDIMRRSGIPEDAIAVAVAALGDDHLDAAHARNYDRLPSVARLLGMPLMCIHNPCDEIGRRMMDETLRNGLPPDPTVQDAVDVLNAIPEFRVALTHIAVRMGRPDNPLGRWAVHHGAGTNGGYPIAKANFDHGVDTVFYIHIEAGNLRRLRQEYGHEGSKNLVVTGHIASDSIGLNAVVRALQERGVRVDRFSGILDTAP